MEDVGIFYGHLVNFTAILYILWPFMVILYICSRSGMLYQEKSGNPGFFMANFNAAASPQLPC
jgi:hypothetical protein